MVNLSNAVDIGAWCTQRLFIADFFCLFIRKGLIENYLEWL